MDDVLLWRQIGDLVRLIIKNIPKDDILLLPIEMMHRNIVATYLVTMSKQDLWTPELKPGTLRLQEFLEVGIQAQGSPTNNELKCAFKSTLDANENKNGRVDLPLDVKVCFITKEGGNTTEILKAFCAKSQVVSDANLALPIKVLLY